MRIQIMLAGIFCMLAACVSYAPKPKPLPPTPPPMPFVSVWAPEQAPAIKTSWEKVITTMKACNGGSLEGKTLNDATLADMKFYSKPLEGGKTMKAGKLYSLYVTDVEFTTAVMLNLTLAKDGKIQECLAEKIIYRSK
jgi:hypothetical protein